ncbi:amidohydrolase family protein [Microbulbifer pacificus]|uniref:Amidohydrolase family protein n=1 Tax=Microbulbifer pacificus TaxID=407164 RepID=A0AAU0N4C8_9GAMM|nr:amidohydrolase family protein [Microbulbifer pacificus]WOX07220.1 amidohydrolase family protein [Microbulbifer pacificus]
MKQQWRSLVLALCAGTAAIGAGIGTGVGTGIGEEGSGDIAVTRLPFTPDSGSIAIRCGRLIDGVGDTPLRDQLVIIRDGRIASVAPADAAPADLPLLALPTHTCLPGLIDTHTHLADSGIDSADVLDILTPEQQLPLSRANARTTLLAGYTVARDLGSYLAFGVNGIRDRINAGEDIGPRIQTAGFYLTIPGGGGDTIVPGRAPETIPAVLRAGVARGPEQFAEKARAAIAGGADVIKVIASGAVLAYGGVPGAPEMTRAEIAAVVREAHAAGLKVAAHAHGAESIKDAILAGADTIEHASLADDESIRLAAARGVAFSMDIYDGDYISAVGRKEGWPEEFVRKGDETTEAQRQVFSAAVTAGVPLIYGTDSAVYPHGWNARQFSYAVARGQSPMAAIQSATSVAAHFMGWEGQVGALKPGLLGDLIAVKGDPLADIRRLEQVSLVVKGGHVFKWRDVE